MDKLRFEFTLLPGNDGKSSVFSITSIATIDDKVYVLPQELQAAGHHKEIIKTATYNKVKNSLTKRYQVRRVWITMTEELKKIYIDEDGNLQFGDQFLEELSHEKLTAADKKETSTMEKLCEKLLDNTQEIRQQNLKSIAEKFVIEKFTSKNSNANQWIDFFEKECIRFDVTADEKKIEILRMFMDKSCVDWYSSMFIKLTMNSEWSTWKNKFCESFANKGWNPVTYALLYKYRDGSLLDYAIRKEKLLLDMRRSIDTGTLIDLIAAGLPEFIMNKIDREALKDSVDLFNEVSKYEHLVNKIRCKINEQEKRTAWTTTAQECVQKYNETIHTVTGFSPSYLLNGTDDRILPKELKLEKSHTNWIKDRKTALENTIKSHNYNKMQFDKNRKDYEFKIGDMVFVENGNKLNRKKLDELKIGPYEIVGKISKSIYEIDTGHKKTESNLFHITKLIPAPT